MWVQEEYLPDGYVQDDGTRSKIRAHTTKEEHEKVCFFFFLTLVTGP